MKKKTVSSLKKQVWKIFSEYIRKRSGGICYTCGYQADWKKLQASHYIPKSLSGNLYFDEINVQACCIRCNMWLLGNLDAFNEHLARDYGSEEIERLRKDKKIIKQWTIKSLEELEKIYTGKIAELESAWYN